MRPRKPGVELYGYNVEMYAGQEGGDGVLE